MLVRFHSVSLAALLFASALFGQDLRPSLRGVVVDPSGSPVARAKIQARNTSTGVVSAGETNEGGQYAILYLAPGDYAVTVTMAGFREILREGIHLETGARAALDFQLELGPVAVAVTVTGDAPLLETETASRGNLVTSRQILDLPSNGRSVYHLAISLSGVVKQSRSFGSFGNAALGNSTAISINGGINRENETVMDGVANTQPTRDVTFQPPIEAVGEMRVQTSNYDASYGRFGGGVVAITTKSGTNSFHGTLFETNRVSALSATSWGLNFLGLRKSGGVSNQFGFEVDGPVFAPKVFDGRNRLFFALALDARRSSSPSTSSAYVPTAEMRQGDLSAVPRTLYDPTTTRMEGGKIVRQAFPLNRIPASRLDPVARRVLEYVPQPNRTAAYYGLPNYISRIPTKSNYDQYMGRLDYRINERNSVYFSYGQLPFLQSGGNLFDPKNPADTSRENPLLRDFRRYVADWAHTLDSRTVINVRAGYSSYIETNQNPPANGFDPRKLGFSDALVSQFRTNMFPRFDLGGLYPSIGSTQVFARSARDTESYQLNVSRLQGRHEFKLGAEFRIYNENLRSPGLASGSYTFGRAFTQADPTRSDNVSGDELATFLLGYPSSGQVDLNIDPAYQGRYFATFIQDDFKVTPRLTLNMGLRWDYEVPFAERYNRMVRGFAFDQPSPIAGQVKGLDLRGGLLYAGTSGEQRLAFNRDLAHVQPRIGAAYQLSRHWVVRGGYGLYFLGSDAYQPSTGFSASSPLVSSSDAGLTPRVTLANAFPEGLSQPFGSSRGLATNLGQGVNFGYVDRPLPYSHQYSFGLQRQFGSNWIAEAAYSGNETRRYPVDANLNVIPASEMGRPATYYTERVPNPLAGLLPLNPAKNGATIPRQDLLVPYPQYTSVVLQTIPIGKNHYNGMQARLTRRYTRGLTVNFVYTWSKTIEELSFLNQQDFNRTQLGASRLERRLAEYDVPQRLTADITYEIPRKKWFGNGVAGLLDRVITGWVVGLSPQYQSGFPATFPNAANLEARSAKLPSDKRNLYNAFNKDLFPRTAPNLQYQLRNFPTRFPDVRLGALKNLDASITKRIAFTEKIRLDLRADIFNLTNTPWFPSQNARGTDVTRPEFGWYAFSSGNSARGMALIGRLSW